MNLATKKNSKQKEYLPWEMQVIKAVDGKGVTADDLMHVLKDRSKGSITNKACVMGSSLKGGVK